MAEDDPVSDCYGLSPLARTSLVDLIWTRQGNYAEANAGDLRGSQILAPETARRGLVK